MSGMIPGVGVPHRRGLNHRVNSELADPYHLGDRSSDSSTGLSEAALRARQRLDKKLSSCLEFAPRLKNQITNKESKGCEDVIDKKSLKFTSELKISSFFS